jgi:hypothetical protein
MHRALWKYIRQYGKWHAVAYHLSSIAGREAIATTLTAITYYLCRDGEITRKPQKEIYSALKNYDEINGSPVASLRYLRAVCLEALRIFPPLVLSLPRVRLPPNSKILRSFLCRSGSFLKKLINRRSTNCFPLEYALVLVEDKSFRFIEYHSMRLTHPEKPGLAGWNCEQLSLNFTSSMISPY